VEFLVGDILNEETCPGPFDVIIERRALQLFSLIERYRVFDKLTARLNRPGIFLSHYHNGAWMPGEPRVHDEEAVFRNNGFIIGNRCRSYLAQLKDKFIQIALLELSTG